MFCRSIAKWKANIVIFAPTKGCAHLSGSVRNRKPTHARSIHSSESTLLKMHLPLILDAQVATTPPVHADTGYARCTKVDK
jgi:hypothetical protein